MAGPIERGRNRLRLFYQAVFSIYVPLLVVSAHEEWPVGRWATKLLRLGMSNGYLADRGLTMEDNRVETIDFFLTWILVALLFASLRIFRTSSSTEPLRIFAGFVAIAGYPLALLYARPDYRIALLIGELAIALVCFGLWVYRKWPNSQTLTILLLLAHYTLWAFLGTGFARGWILLWPAWYERPGANWFAATYPWLIYPVLGLCFTLVWAAHVTQSEREMGSQELRRG